MPPSEAPRPLPRSAESAIGKSISFRPGSLYRDVEAFGRAQRAKIGHELNPSQVVCLALERLFTAENFARPTDQQEVHAVEQAELLALAEEIGLPAALETLRSTLRRPVAAGSAAA
jgi:hypothetical protein